MRLKERFQLTQPLEQMEVALVRAATQDPHLVTVHEEAVLRTALSLARLYRVNNIGVGAFVAPFREEVTRRLGRTLLGKARPTREALLPHVRDLEASLRTTRAALERRLSTRVAPEIIDRELRHKALVLVCGGGGGTAYVYLGAMALLDQLGVQPSLLVGTSMGAVISLFRARATRFDQAEMINIVRSLSWRKLFRAISTESRYGVPAALRLFLRAGVGRYFHETAESVGPTLRQMPIKTIVAVGGLRRGMLPRPLEFYERMIQSPRRRLLDPLQVARRVQASMGAIAEFFTRPEMLTRVHLGLDPGTDTFDALDAVGFSSALPGVIHYDVLRDDGRMRNLLDGLFEQRRLFRLVDGGLTDNVPARAAWRAVHKGHVGTRNAFILALNAFCPKLTTPLWLPLQRLAELSVTSNRPYAHLFKDFRRTLSPLELVPSVETLTRAIEMGRAQLRPDLDFIARMLAPLPALGSAR